MRILIIFLVFSNISFSQTEESKSFFLNEYTFSVNRSVYNFNLNTYGFGFGGYKTFGKPNKLNFLTGFEYNYTKQVQAYEFTGGHSSNDIDTNKFLISMNAISVPANLRYTIGNKTKIFADFGFFVEIILNSKRIEIDYANSNDPLKSFSKGSEINTFNFGGVFGLGLSHQIGKIEYYLKPEFRYGLFNNRYLKLCVGVMLN